MPPIDPNEHDWWKRAVFYQVYPRSFQDSDGDGIGDLAGIIDRLDHLNDAWGGGLGIDAIWLSPTFPSPMKDFGYDVSDYCDVHPDFGDLETMDRLITECHRRGVRLLLDFVPNHSSDRHPWFIESRSGRDSAKRDWYYWRDPNPDGSPPNNWISAFGGPAWEYDEASGQYYLHSFLVEQPDLNWRNPAVVESMHDALRFWLRRGVDGFRIDVMHMVLKHPDMPDNPLNPDWREGMPESQRQIWAYNRNYPEVIDAVHGVRAVLDEFPGAMAVGEVYGDEEAIARLYGGPNLGGLHLAFNFQLIVPPGGSGRAAWDAPTIASTIVRSAQALPAAAQPCFALGNHDQPRFISRNDRDGHGRDRAAGAALLLLGLRSTPFLYYGEEIGMVDGVIPEDRLRDPARFHSRGRDPERTPMQWDERSGRGFTTGEPWLPFGPSDINVSAQRDQQDSLLGVYRRALAMRRREPSLREGSQEDVGAHGDVVSLVRRAAGAPPVFVAVNTGAAAATTDLPFANGTVLVSSDVREDGSHVHATLELGPFGAAWARAD